jgi:integrase
VTSPKSNPKNDRVKRDYLVWLKEAKQRSLTTVDQARHAIDRLEAYTGYKDFGTFNKDQAIGFKRALLASLGKRSGKPVRLATAHHALQSIRDFLAWLSAQHGYRRRVTLGDIAYLNLTRGEERQAHATGPKEYASLEDYRAALFEMPAHTEIERRDQAVMALMLATGMRDAAIVSLKLRHVSLDRNRVFQDPREVRTKLRKPIETFFFPVGDDVIAIVRGWVTFLTTDKVFGPDDPLFPKTIVGWDADNNFSAQGISLEHWANATPVRKMFRAAFARVDLPYANPHSIRNTLTQLAYKLQLTHEQFKAWSQNMGHDMPLTTLNSYGHVSAERQAEIIDGLSRQQHPVTPEDAFADKVAVRVAALMQADTSARGVVATARPKK